jgi:glutamine amidotransferase
MTVATSDGKRIWGFRYSTEHESRTLFYSTDVATVRALHPEVEILHDVSDESRLIVSEPIRDLPGAWNEVPESSWGVVDREGHDELHPFTPRAPSRPVSVPAVT